MVVHSVMLSGLKRERERADVLQYELANRAWVNTQVVRKHERHGVPCPVDLAIRYAEVLEVPLYQLTRTDEQADWPSNPTECYRLLTDTPWLPDRREEQG